MTMHYLPGHLFNVSLNLLGAIKLHFRTTPECGEEKGQEKFIYWLSSSTDRGFLKWALTPLYFQVAHVWVFPVDTAETKGLAEW